eukprot:CAMPEP_0114161046 /NCGR_PEP_ID=MMETSP0043_2-20121206/28712_1 /TAXON_ID=464988 /ORGANISM="Hemiselmis andersenii, Strain CCMP644" /LENGTH=151 /DNA_ID=CAMNT_0001257187 /DNA_START=1 /DNA_END=454 /DNA_ORIENTATION=+
MSWRRVGGMVGYALAAELSETARIIPKAAQAFTSRQTDTKERTIATESTSHERDARGAEGAYFRHSEREVAEAPPRVGEGARQPREAPALQERGGLVARGLCGPQTEVCDGDAQAARGAERYADAAPGRRDVPSPVPGHPPKVRRGPGAQR